MLWQVNTSVGLVVFLRRNFSNRDSITTTNSKPLPLIPALIHSVHAVDTDLLSGEAVKAEGCLLMSYAHVCGSQV